MIKEEVPDGDPRRHQTPPIYSIQDERDQNDSDDDSVSSINI